MTGTQLQNPELTPLASLSDIKAGDTRTYSLPSGHLASALDNMTPFTCTAPPVNVYDSEGRLIGQGWQEADSARRFWRRYENSRWSAWTELWNATGPFLPPVDFDVKVMDSLKSLRG